MCFLVLFALLFHAFCAFGPHVLKAACFKSFPVKKFEHTMQVYFLDLVIPQKDTPVIPHLGKHTFNPLIKVPPGTRYYGPGGTRLLRGRYAVLGPPTIAVLPGESVSQ